MLFVFNIECEPAHTTPGTGTDPDQFAAKLRHIGMIARVPGHSENPFDRAGLRSTRLAPHSVIVITNFDLRRQEQPHDRVAGNART